jgi:hypothetical protein
MAAVEITISGVLYDKYNRTQQNVIIFGEASLTGLQVGGGPMPGGPPPWVSHPIPPVVWPNPPGGGGQPNPPWWPGHPEHPIPPTVWPTPPGSGGQPQPPLGTWGGDSPWPGYATPPIYIPPLPPDTAQPSPGDPTTPLPPPAGSPGWPVQGIVPPPYIVVNYPGVGPVIVAPPETSATTPPA